jgi:hypothetical protein
LRKKEEKENNDQKSILLSEDRFYKQKFFDFGKFFQSSLSNV